MSPIDEPSEESQGPELSPTEILAQKTEAIQELFRECRTLIEETLTTNQAMIIERVQQTLSKGAKVTEEQITDALDAAAYDCLDVDGVLGTPADKFAELLNEELLDIMQEALDEPYDRLLEYFEDYNDKLMSPEERQQFENWMNKIFLAK